MNNLSAEEAQLIAIIRDLKQFETIEIKLDEQNHVMFTYTQKKRYLFLTKNS